jgi:hypothetical protein
MIGEPGDNGPGVASVGAPLPVMPPDEEPAPVVALEVEGAPLVPASPDWPGLDTRRSALSASKRQATGALQGTISSFLEKALDPCAEAKLFANRLPAGQTSALRNRFQNAAWSFPGLCALRLGRVNLLQSRDG